jgi:alpha-amylase
MRLALPCAAAAIVLAGGAAWLTAGVDAEPAPALHAAARPDAARRPAHATEIVFQAFTWNAEVGGQRGVWYRHLAPLADELAAAGVTHVWFPPASRSVSPQGYMPGDLYDLGSGDAPGDNRTLYGNQAELVACVKAFHARGMACLADVVLNHRCASHQEAGVWNVFHHPSGRAMWERWALARGDYGGTGQADTGADFAPAPDVDHANARVRDDIVEWLAWMRRAIGFDGFRFDFSKGYAPRFVKEYLERTSTSFAIGEYWSSMDYSGATLEPQQDSHRQLLCDWIDGTGGMACAFDFTTKGLLQEAVGRGEYWRLKDRHGKAAGLLGWWPARSVTFLDNHDTGSTQAHWPFPRDGVLAGYAYILTHPGLPAIFWDHLRSWDPAVRETIVRLARLRHDLGLSRESRLEILLADQTRYAARVDGKVTLLLGQDGWQPGEGWRPRLSGPGFRIWTRE